MNMNDNGRWGIAGRVCALSALLMAVTAYGEGPSTGQAVAGGHGDDDGHGHGTAAAPAATLEQRVSAECECGVPAYTCAECRYEVGVVKVDASLLKRDDGGGLVLTQAVARMQVSMALPATGEVSLNEN